MRRTMTPVRNGTTTTLRAPGKAHREGTFPRHPHGHDRRLPPRRAARLAAAFACAVAGVALGALLSATPPSSEDTGTMTAMGTPTADCRQRSPLQGLHA